MVLELKPPQRADLQALIPLWPGFMGYVLSFIDVGICWTKLQYVSYPSIWGFTLTLELMSNLVYAHPELQ